MSDLTQGVERQIRVILFLIAAQYWWEAFGNRPLRACLATLCWQQGSWFSCESA